MADALAEQSLISAQDENKASAELREAKKRNSDGENADEGESQSGSLREKYLKARNALDVKSKIKEKTKEKLNQAIGSPSRVITATWLRGCWWSLIPTFGFSIFLIDAIVFANKVMGNDVVCPLGHEWLPASLAKANPGMVEKYAMIELIIFSMVNAIMGVIVLTALGIMVMITDFMMADTLVKIKMIVGGLTSLSWSAVEAFYSLFAGSGS